MYKIGTFYGKTIDYKNPTADQIDIRDIAHNLSQENRFLGKTKKPYSVAQHCVLGSVILEEMGTPELALMFLLHDAAEAYLKDIPTPLKKLLGSTYLSIEYAFQRVIYDKFNLNHFEVDHEDIKRIDLAMLATEKEQLIGDDGVGWEQLKGVASANIHVFPWPHDVAEKQYLEQFKKLMKEVNDGWSE